MPAKNMIERGIHTTKATIWCHLFPHEYKMFWYWVRHMKEYIKKRNPPVMPGRSKDGTVTGSGYLIPKSLAFIREVAVPAKIIDSYNWAKGTDRQIGLKWGEEVFDLLVSLGYFSPPHWMPGKFRGKERQISAGDFQLSTFIPCIELKTETVINTPNLFVQIGERDHNVHLVIEDGQCKTRYTDAPGLK